MGRSVNAGAVHGARARASVTVRPDDRPPPPEGGERAQRAASGTMAAFTSGGAYGAFSDPKQPRSGRPIGEALATALGTLGQRVHEARDVRPTTPVRVSAAGNFQAAKEGWLKVVASCPKLSGADYAVAIVIATHLNSKTGDAWPSLATLAELTHRDASTVWRSVERLSSFGLLQVRKGRGRTESNRYRPLLGNFDPETMRRRKQKTASSHAKHCEFAERT